MVEDHQGEREHGTTNEQPLRMSLAFLTGPNLNSAEKVQLKVIGRAMAHIDDTDLYTNDLNIRAGLVEEGVSSNPLLREDVGDYTAIVTYKTGQMRPRQGTDAHISSYPNLTMFAEAAARSMYVKGLEP